MFPPTRVGVVPILQSQIPQPILVKFGEWKPVICRFLCPTPVILLADLVFGLAASHHDAGRFDRRAFVVATSRVFHLLSNPAQELERDIGFVRTSERSS
jgi:hypothetical protein